MSNLKKIPERMCVVCRQMKPKNQLLRVVNTLEGVIVDESGKFNGRGVYLCRCKECVAKALKSKNFAKLHGFQLDAVADKLEKLVEQ